MPESGPPRHVVLIGIPGAGKSAVGRLLGRRLGRRVVDLDEAVVASAGRSIAALFAEEGEDGFRARELEATRAVAESPMPLVITPGGGWATRPDAVALLAPKALIVWLDATPDEAFSRMGAGWRRRPLLTAAGSASGARRILADLAEKRRPAYESAASQRVETQGRTIGRICDIIEGFVRL